MDPLPQLKKGPKWLRESVSGINAAIVKNRPVAGVGTKVYDSPGGRVIDSDSSTGGGASSSNDSFAILTRNNGTSESPEWQAGVVYNSSLFRSVSYTDQQAITGLLSADQSSGWFPTIDGDVIWLEIGFGTWPAVNSAAINNTGSSDVFPGEIVDDGEPIPTQTKACLVIGTISISGGEISVNQIVQTNQRMVNVATSTVAALYPEAI